MNLEEAIIRVESSDRLHPDGNDYVVGDLNEEWQAYGPMQIRWPCVSDVNMHFGTNFRAKMCKGNRELSKEIFRYYAKILEKRLKRKPTDEQISRHWNGGWGGILYPKRTDGYWKKVQGFLAK